MVDVVVAVVVVVVGVVVVVAIEDEGYKVVVQWMIWCDTDTDDEEVKWNIVPDLDEELDFVLETNELDSGFDKDCELLDIVDVIELNELQKGKYVIKILRFIAAHLV